MNRNDNVKSKQKLPEHRLSKPTRLQWTPASSHAPHLTLQERNFQASIDLTSQLHSTSKSNSKLPKLPKYRPKWHHSKAPEKPNSTTAAVSASASCTHAGTPVRLTPPCRRACKQELGADHILKRTAIIEPLLAGTKAKLLASGVKESNIVVQSVPGSWELPIACSKYMLLFNSCPSPAPEPAIL